MGAKTFRLEIEAGDGGLRGAASTGGETTPMQDLREEAGRLRWSMKMPRPMNVVLDVDVVLDGGELRGSAKAGHMPLPDVRGVRASS
jgi:hypothetical protein